MCRTREKREELISMTSSEAPHHAVDEARLTGKLLLLVVALSFGTWFPIGFAMGIVNAPQREIIHWIRQVKCQRLGVAPLDEDSEWKSNGSAVEAQATSPCNRSLPFLEGGEDESVTLWCSSIEGVSQTRLLSENTELNTLWALVASLMPLGSCVTVWFMNYFINTFGSKRTLLFTNIFGIVGAVLSGMCKLVGSFELLIFGRIVIGMNIGLVISIVPLYVAEISPSNLRGMMGTIPGLTLVTGTLVATLLGLPSLLGTATWWQFLSFVLLVPYFSLWITLPFFPESPRFLLINKKDSDAARKALEWLRGRTDVLAELKMIQTERDHDAGDVLSIAGLFGDKLLRSTVFLSCTLILSQQLTGIGAFLTYSTGIFTTAGLAQEEAIYGTVGLMGLQILAVLAALLLMDRAGRKMLLVIGYAGAVLTNGVMVGLMTFAKGGSNWAQYICIGCVLLFMVVYNLGPAFVPWILVSEMFEKRSSGAAMMIVSTCSHVSGITIVFLFPILHAAMDEWVFGAFSCCSGLFALFVWSHAVETKGKTFEEIQDGLRSRYK